MAVAQGSERKLVTVFGASNKDGIGKPLVDERPVGPEISDDSTDAPRRRLHAPTLDGCSSAKT
jgi:hypothetical protein